MKRSSLLSNNVISNYLLPNFVKNTSRKTIFRADCVKGILNFISGGESECSIKTFVSSLMITPSLIDNPFSFYLMYMQKLKQRKQKIRWSVPYYVTTSSFLCIILFIPIVLREYNNSTINQMLTQGSLQCLTFYMHYLS